VKQRVGSVDHVPRIRAQRSIAHVWPTDATGWREPTPPGDERPGRYLPGQLGRWPTVGLDEGAIRHTRPDTSPINKR
jgi:hypothetical protein